MKPSCSAWFKPWQHWSIGPDVERPPPPPTSTAIAAVTPNEAFLNKAKDGMVQFQVTVLPDLWCFRSRKPHTELEFLVHGSRLETLNQLFLQL